LKEYRLKIFCDFDGTVTENDIWISCLYKFVRDKKKFESIISDFEEMVIGAKECLTSLLPLIEDFSFEKFHEYLDEEKIDPFFRDFIKFCEEENFPLTIVSGGFDYYIEYLLNREDLNVNYCSTKLIWEKSNDSKIVLGCEFTYDDEHCYWCETSKRNILINNTNDLDNEISVYIGDGISDFCVANYADVVFAKGKLASYCWKNNITYFDYINFNDIIKKLKKLIEGKSHGGKLKQRQEAKIKRRDVLLGG
jgi:2-hydroxy-3-keto-5-methylthiopentenyl-1-phosphate phosphatase